jgi:hypothetical protein
MAPLKKGHLNRKDAKNAKFLDVESDLRCFVFFAPLATLR